ncbi:AAA family ATPase [Paracholeplasma manati]|uniref:AAA family ATPase n=1 Tax=Paracholeplasma manati TaxID=591373 RepID=UPI0024083848|nr:AAA family ATPase [Paracholeplasma manati]MDG0889182.1 AAA family ATPase [Paracholeplasma manati]
MKTTFDNIAGYNNEKLEVMSICNMFNNYQTYKDKGITLPKGLLLYGEPGVGKTLFAKAIANEINRSFIEINFKDTNGLNDKEILQNKFDEAKQKAPSILFIDELDKLVPNDSSVMGFVSDESRSILAHLLTLIDGFNDIEEVMLICTTNQIANIPTALIRTGRIDKHLFIGKPNDHSRKAILEYYLNKLDFDKDIDMRQITLSTDGLTGSDIKTIINESAISVLNAHSNVITTNQIISMIERIDGKTIPTNQNTIEEEIIAIHELGHFVVLNSLKKTIKDISINGYNNSLGRVRAKDDRQCLSKEDILNEVTIALGGMAAEELFFNETFTTSYKDATNAYEMLEHALNHGHFGFKFVTSGSRSFMMGGVSMDVKAKITELLLKSYEKAKAIVGLKEKDINEIKPQLLKNKILTSTDLKEYFSGQVMDVIPESNETTFYNPFIDRNPLKSILDDYENEI